MSQQGGLFWSRPPRGLGGFSVVGGRSDGEERRKASPCFLRLLVRGPYVVRTNGCKSLLQKVFIFLEMFLANYTAPKYCSKMMYVS